MWCARTGLLFPAWDMDLADVLMNCRVQLEFGEAGVQELQTYCRSRTGPLLNKSGPASIAKQFKRVLSIAGPLDYMSQDPAWWAARLFKILLDMAFGVQHLHAVGYVHLDLSVHNVAVRSLSASGEASDVQAALLDLGRTKRIDSTAVLRGHSGFPHLPVVDFPRTSMCDVYSMGAVMVVVATLERRSDLVMAHCGVACTVNPVWQRDAKVSRAMTEMLKLASTCLALNDKTTGKEAPTVERVISELFQWYRSLLD